MFELSRSAIFLLLTNELSNLSAVPSGHAHYECKRPQNVGTYQLQDEMKTNVTFCSLNNMNKK